MEPALQEHLQNWATFPMRILGDQAIVDYRAAVCLIPAPA
jgi:hypothetical protein